MINDSVKNCSHLAFITFEYYLISITFSYINRKEMTQNYIQSLKYSIIVVE